MISLRLAVAFLLLATLPVLAHSYKIGAIEIGHPWAPPGHGADRPVYLALSNRGDAADRLLTAASPIARSVELRSDADAVLSEIALLPKRPMALRPGRPHL